MCDQESKTRSGGFRRFMSAVIYCMRLSWETSPLYSLIRAFAYIANALLPFVTLYASKYLLDMLAAAGHAEQPFADAVFLLLAISGVSVFKLMLNKLIQYTQNIHNELMANRIQIGLMTKSMSIDMEFFDSPDYMDALICYRAAYGATLEDCKLKFDAGNLNIDTVYRRLMDFFVE